MIKKPWGSYEVLSEGEGYKIKKITVNKDQRLSLQSHRYRAEVWSILEGRGMFTLGESEIFFGAGAVMNINQGVKHRISAKEKVTFIEIQRGDILEEEDIIRYSDDYNRV